MVATTASDAMNKPTQRRVLSGMDFNQLVFVAMLTFGHQLRSYIRGRIWIGPQDGQFFCQAQTNFESSIWYLWEEAFEACLATQR